MMGIFKKTLLGLLCFQLLSGPAWAQLDEPAVVEMAPLPERLSQLEASFHTLNRRVREQREMQLLPEYTQTFYQDTLKLWDEVKNLETNSPNYLSKVRNIYTHFLQLQIQLMPSRPLEMRGALIDAGMLETSPEAVRELVKKYKKAGFNTLIPEVFRRGRSLFANRVSMVDPSFAYKKADILKVLVTEAQKEGMQVYPWFWVFRLLSPTINKENPLLERLPTLRYHPLKEAYRSTNENIENEAESFVSPAAFEWQELLIHMMTEMQKQYPVKGILLDYIRYGDNQIEDQLSWTRFQLHYFHKVGSFPPLTVDPQSDLQREWHLWREEQVNWMVKKLRQATGPDMSLGAAVFRNEINARNTKMQNWRHWSDNHWLDFVSPMMYATNVQDLDLWLDWETEQETRKDMLYPILGAHRTRLQFSELFNQISLLRDRHIPGVSIFAMRNLSDNMLAHLEHGPFRRPALLPHLNAPGAVRAQISDIAAWIRTMKAAPNPPPYLKNISSFEARLSQISAALNGATNTNGKVRPEAVISYVRSLQNTLEPLQGSWPLYFRLELKSRMDYAERLAEIYKFQIDSQLTYTPPSNPPTAVMPEAKPIPRLKVPYVEKPPLMDGLLDDETWSKASYITPFYWHTGSAFPKVKTVARIAYDKDNLYVSYQNTEPRMDRVASEFDKRNFKRTFEQQDTIELFINPTNNLSSYYYFVVNAHNNRYQRATFDSAWSGPWKSATYRTDGRWQAEVQIPFNTLRFPSPVKGGTWRGNFCRRRPQEINPYHCWSFTLGGIHRADRLGHLEFEPQPEPTPEPSVPSEP